MNTYMRCDDCGHIWRVPELDKSGEEYNGDDLYSCPNCKSENFGELQ